MTMSTNDSNPVETAAMDAAWFALESFAGTTTDPEIVAAAVEAAAMDAAWIALESQPPKLTADSLAVARKTQFREAIARAHRKANP
jgi:hypothetical protein